MIVILLIPVLIVCVFLFPFLLPPPPLLLLLLQVEEPDEAIKMFNDVDLVLDVVSCVQLAIKLRAKYFKKVRGSGV